MSQTDDERNDSDLPLVEEVPTEQTPAVAGGGDDTDPEQGEGEADSY